MAYSGKVLFEKLYFGPTENLGKLFGRFGRWKVVGYVGKNPNAIWLCVCECGTTKKVDARSLASARSKSCGCYRDEFRKSVRNPKFTTKGLKFAPETLGKSQTPEGKAFYSARSRCQNIKARDYPDYGGRGILFKFLDMSQWLAYLGSRPSSEHSVDRIDNDGHYEPGNVRWATQAQQCANQRKRRRNIKGRRSKLQTPASLVKGI